mgnify:CR=1 FL=1
MKYLAYVLLVMLAIAGCDDDNPADSDNAPKIHKIEPQEAIEGEEVKFTGINFGEAKGESAVYFNGVKVEEHPNWSDTEIIAIVAPNAESGKVWVEVGGHKSNEHDFLISLSQHGFSQVKIGKQIWMKTNLNVDHYRNGDSIPQVQDWEEWGKLTTGAWCYLEDTSYHPNKIIKTWGKYYNWYAVNDPRGLAPEGWHIPTDDEWKQLEMTLGMSQSQADATGERGNEEGSYLAGRYDLWFGGELSYPNKFGSSGFNGLPGQGRDGTGIWSQNANQFAYWWTSSPDNSKDYLAWSRSLWYSSTKIFRTAEYKNSGYCIRCVKDE